MQAETFYAEHFLPAARAATANYTDKPGAWPRTLESVAREAAVFEAMRLAHIAAQEARHTNLAEVIRNLIDLHRSASALDGDAFNAMDDLHKALADYDKAYDVGY